ncbi:MAG: sigma-70 family RNA polymerase sigma factor [Clostridia bacterium]|nr:sigma-70 family RNA polymerase sigma factor [Clostridia bacterium]
MKNRVERFNNLIRKIAKGKSSAVDEIYSEFGGLMFVYAKKYLYDKSYAEDLVSEVLFKIIKGAKTFDYSKNGLNWMLKIIKNSAINHNISFSKVQYEVADETAFFDAFSEDFIANKLDLQRSIKFLTDEEKRVLTLTYWEGYTLREIAKIINKSTTSTHRVLKSALLKIKKSIKGDV